MSRYSPVRDAGWAKLTDDLRNGRTQKQQDEQMARKMLLGAGTMALTTGAGIYEGYKSQERDKAIAARAQGKVDDGYRKEASQYADANQTHETGGGSAPAWLSQAQGEAPEGPDPFSAQALDDLKRRQEVNLAAAGANIGGYRTPKALDDHDAESDTLAADMNTGKNLMKAGGMMTGGGSQMGGMMSSLRRSY